MAKIELFILISKPMTSFYISIYCDNFLNVFEWSLKYENINTDNKTKNNLFSDKRNDSFFCNVINS